jgi:hypothetical protein
MTRDPKRILIAICLRSHDTRWEVTQALVHQLVSSYQSGYTFDLLPGGGCDVAHSRNLALHYWNTRSVAGRLVFIDSDVPWTPEKLFKLLAWDVPYVGGLYPLKGLRLRWGWNGWARESTQTPGLWVVKELCTGFTCLRYDLYLRMCATYPRTAYVIEDNAFRGELAHELYAMGPIGRTPQRRMSEDFMFSERVHNLGVEVNVDPTVLVGHIGAVDLLEMHKGLGTFELPQLRE